MKNKFVCISGPTTQKNKSFAPKLRIWSPLKIRLKIYSKKHNIDKLN